MAKKSDPTAAARQAARRARLKAEGVESLQLFAPKSTHASLQRIAAALAQNPYATADAVELVLYYRDKRGRLRPIGEVC